MNISADKAVPIIQSARDFTIDVKKANQSYFLTKEGQWEKIGCLERFVRAIFSKIFCCCVTSTAEVALKRTITVLSSAYAVLSKNQALANGIDICELVCTNSQHMKVPERIIPIARDVDTVSRNFCRERAAALAPAPVPLDPRAAALMHDAVPSAGIVDSAKVQNYRSATVLLINPNGKAKTESLNYDLDGTVGDLKKSIQESFSKETGDHSIEVTVTIPPLSSGKSRKIHALEDDNSKLSEYLGPEGVECYFTVRCAVAAVAAAPEQNEASKSAVAEAAVAVAQPSLGATERRLTVNFAGEMTPGPRDYVFDLTKTIGEIKAQLRECLQLKEDTQFSILIGGTKRADDVILGDVLGERNSLIAYY